MADVYLNVHGNGMASTDALPPMVDGEPFTITLTPDPDASVERVVGYDSHDYAVAIPAPVDNVIYMNFRSGWGSLYVDIYFSGSEPPEPGPGTLPLWLLFLNNKWWRKLK